MILISSFMDFPVFPETRSAPRSRQWLAPRLPPPLPREGLFIIIGGFAKKKLASGYGTVILFIRQCHLTKSVLQLPGAFSKILNPNKGRPKL
jgi:hypothetical protein